MRCNLQVQEQQEDCILVASGCSAYLLNFLAQEQRMKEQIVSVPMYFSNRPVPSTKYKKDGASALKMPQDVLRWNTIAAYLESYVKNWPLMLKVKEENRDLVGCPVAKRIFS